jgi:hypothetical protein
MKTNPINIVKGLNGLHYAKTKESKVFLPIDMDDEMYNKISSQLSNLEYFAKHTKKPIIFYPKGMHATLMNYGTKTLILNNNAAKSEVAAQIYKNINDVVKLDSCNKFSKII